MAVVVAGANVHDAKLLRATLEAVVVERPEPTAETPQHLCLDKGYDNPSGWQATIEQGYEPHIRRIGEEKLDERRRSGARPVAGWSSAHWPGCRSAGRSWSATTRRHATTSP